MEPTLSSPEVAENQPAPRQTRDFAASPFGQAFIRSLMSNVAPGVHSRLFATGTHGYLEYIDYGRRIRDEWMHEFAILPGAINSFVEVSTSREWMVIGPPRLAARAVEKLHGAYFRDRQGIVHDGWHNVLRQMCKDWLTIGRCAFNSPLVIDLATYRGAIEYLDSSRLYPIKDLSTGTYWQYIDPYDGVARQLQQADVFFDDCDTGGAEGLPIGKVHWLLPIARLEWYLREHMTAKLDGRKIRDIFLVEDNHMVEQFEHALNSAMAAQTGDTFEEWGLPIVALNRMGIATGATKVEDSFARIGLSEMPDQLDPEALEFRYANEISSVLGLSLRYFWNDPRGTNRSVEQINQERQSVQGPSYFMRNIERLLNNSTVLSASPRKVRFKFEEEIDSVSAERKAKTFKTRAEGFQILYNLVSPQMMPTQNPITGTMEQVAPERLNPELLDPRTIISFMEREGLLTTDVTLPDMVTMEEYALQRTYGDDRQLPDPLDYGEVCMNSEGIVLERRLPVFLKAEYPKAE